MYLVIYGVALVRDGHATLFLLPQRKKKDGTQQCTFLWIPVRSLALVLVLFFIFLKCFCLGWVLAQDAVGRGLLL